MVEVLSDPALRADRVEVHADAEAASRAYAEAFAECVETAVEARGRFDAMLTGGSSPERAYRLLGEAPLRDHIPWERVHLWWGDERAVPPGHPRSNFGMARRAFAGHVPIPLSQVHRIRGELPPAEAARRYADELRTELGEHPVMDLVHLGIGPDAHVCSLFPFDRLLRARRVLTGTSIRLPEGEPRVTVTFPVVNIARRVQFIALEEGKAEAVAATLRGPLDPFRLPAQNVRPLEGELWWTLDRAAAAGLEGSTGGRG